MSEELKQFDPKGVTSDVESNPTATYSIQDRNLPLEGKFELGAGFGYNFSGSGYLKTTQVEGSARYHFSDRYSLGIHYSRSTNTLNSSGQGLLNSGIVPDVAYPRYRMSLLLGINLFYGKLRFSPESTSYFDQYIAFGPGRVVLNRNTATSAVLDVGFVFWLWRFGSLRFGVQNELFKEKREFSDKTVLHAIGHVDVGVLF